MCPATVWIISGLRSRRKNDTAPASELFASWTWLRLQLRSSWFSWVLLRIRSSLFYVSGSDFCSFSHI